MLETAETGATLSKDEYEAALPELRVDLVNAQFDARKADFPVLIVLSGDDREGVKEVLNLLHEWMDPRYLDAHLFGAPRDEERGRPRLWRYWQVLPGRGEIGVYAGAYALGLLSDRLTGESSAKEALRRLEHAVRLERTLVDEGALLLKFWLHLPPKQRQKRLKKARKRPERSQLEEIDLELYERHDDAVPLIEHFLRRTSTAWAPWHVVESTDARHRNLGVAREIRDALVRRLKDPAPVASPAARVPSAAPGGSGVLNALDLDGTLPRGEYKKQLDGLQARLRQLGRRCRERNVSSVVLFEGWDAAGKGGVIRRITRAMDVRDYRVVPVGAPTPEEKAHHFLWRFWRRLPGPGRMLICDRSWYGRVLVERVEGLAPEDAWARAYEAINDFEEQLVQHGMPIVKYWLHIDPATQLERFEARAQTPYKKHKLTPEDHRNREQWPAYAAAVEDMVARTSTDLAPWHLIQANDKRFARVRALEILCDALEQAAG